MTKISIVKKTAKTETAPNGKPSPKFVATGYRLAVRRCFFFFFFYCFISSVLLQTVTE